MFCPTSLNPLEAAWGRTASGRGRPHRSFDLGVGPAAKTAPRETGHDSSSAAVAPGGLSHCWSLGMSSRTVRSQGRRLHLGRLHNLGSPDGAHVGLGGCAPHHRIYEKARRPYNDGKGGWLGQGAGIGESLSSFNNHWRGAIRVFSFGRAGGRLG